MKEVKYQFSLSSPDEKPPIGNRGTLGSDIRIQRDGSPVEKYTNLGTDENIAYSSWAAEAAADSYIASKSNNSQHKKRSNHAALFALAIIATFICTFVFTYIYADGGWDALFADGGFEALLADLKDLSSKETSKPQEKETWMSFEEWRKKEKEKEKASLTPVSEPTSGTILSGCRVVDGSELTISTSNHPCVVKLKDYAGVTKLSFYVRKNTKITMTVPYEYMYVYFASGETWYGYNHLFGEGTSYSKDDDLLDFNNYTFEYTLYPVTNGNFTETKISENEFKE